MRVLSYVCLVGLLCLSATGCSTTPRYSQAQLNAIETREVEANLNETFNAASGALFDAGYTISMSDREAGLLTGTQGESKSAERFWISPYIQDTQFAVSIQVREIAEKRSSVRIKTSKNGEPRVNKKAIDAIWILMQRQVLMKEPMKEAVVRSRPYTPVSTEQVANTPKTQEIFSAGPKAPIRQDRSIVIKGIVWGERPAALIGGQIVREGGSVLGARVVKINKDSVEFEKDGKTWRQGVSG
ncbi:MAG: hypothetical protein JXN61_17835 [Sedimentisphaerales bacterium]|nr:hypothetical protein [Sedimentisphaerales bacterium]